MLKGRVIGSIWATRRVDQLPNGAFLEVEVDGGAGSSPSTCSAAGSASAS